MTSARILLAAAAVVLFAQLILPPAVGVANNGDFSRTYGIFHLTMPVADEVRFAAIRYQFDPRVNYFGGFYSSEILLLPPALALNAIFSKDGQFDIRWLAMIHGALFLAAFYLFLTALPGRRLLAALALAMFGDVMYVAYLNSFYTDVAALLFLLLSLALALRVLRWNRPADLACFAVAALLLITSKAQHAALGFWLAALFYLLAAKSPIRRARWFTAVLVLAAVLWLAKSTPQEYAARGCFSTIFGHILPHSADPARTLADLGLDSSYRPYIGMIAFSGGSPMGDPHFVADFARKVPYSRLALFFLTHPRDAYVAIRVSLDEAGRQRPPLGNFDSSASLPPNFESRAFAFWSNFKRAAFENRGSRYFTCFLATCAALALLLVWQRRTLPTSALPAGLILIGMAATELAVSSLADAMEPARHALLFYALFDLVLLAAVGLIMRSGRGANRPELRR